MNEIKSSQKTFATEELNEKYKEWNNEMEAVNKKYDKNKAILLVDVKATEEKISMSLNERKWKIQGRLTLKKSRKIICCVNNWSKRIFLQEDQQIW